MEDNEQTFPKSARLLKSVEFQRVYRSRHYAADGTLVVCGVRNSLGEIRLGLSISRKVGNAVERNRWKRCIREVFRKCRSNLPTGLDVVVRPKRGATCDFHAIERSLPKLVDRLAKSIERKEYDRRA